MTRGARIGSKRLIHAHPGVEVQNVHAVRVEAIACVRVGHPSVRGLSIGSPAGLLRNQWNGTIARIGLQLGICPHSVRAAVRKVGIRLDVILVRRHEVPIPSATVGRTGVDEIRARAPRPSPGICTGRPQATQCHNRTSARENLIVPPTSPSSVMSERLRAGDPGGNWSLQPRGARPRPHLDGDDTVPHWVCRIT